MRFYRLTSHKKNNNFTVRLGCDFAFFRYCRNRYRCFEVFSTVVYVHV